MIFSNHLIKLGIYGYQVPYNSVSIPTPWQCSREESCAVQNSPHRLDFCTFKMCCKLQI